jgi:hypothetical protein
MIFMAMGASIGSFKYLMNFWKQLSNKKETRRQ